MYLWRWICVFCTLMLVLSPVAHAKRVALVMGNDNYSHVSKLEKAGNELSAMRAAEINLPFGKAST